MSRGRRQGPELVKLQTWIPADVMLELQLMLFDPFRGQTKYGALSALMTDLIRQWLAGIKKGDPK